MNSPDDQAIRYEVLGPLRAFRGGDELPLGPAKQRTVLAVLLLAEGTGVGRDEIVEAVWGRDAPTGASGVVATYIARLRKVLEPDRSKRAAAATLVSDQAGRYALRLVTADDLDLHRFEALSASARAARADGDLDRCAAILGRAVDLWRGSGLDGLSGPFAAGQRRRLDELRLGAVEERFEAEILRGRHGAVIAELSGAAARYAHRERLKALLMLALYRCGRQSEALAVFSDFRTALIGDLGIEPGRELRDLQYRILNSDPALHLGATRPHAARSHTAPAQLPAAVPDFSGRRAQTRALVGFLAASGSCGESVPLALVTGPAGVGKTTLAIACARKVLDRFSDGQLFADLCGSDRYGPALTGSSRNGFGRTGSDRNGAHLHGTDRNGTGGRPRDPAEILARFLRDLGVVANAVPPELEQRAVLYRTLTSGRRLLIVLDDAADPEQIRLLIPGSPSCAVVVTSRARMPETPAGMVLDLGYFTDDEGLELLTAIVGTERIAADREAARRAVRTSGGLPLALRIAGASASAPREWNPDGIGDSGP